MNFGSMLIRGSLGAALVAASLLLAGCGGTDGTNGKDGVAGGPGPTGPAGTAGPSGLVGPAGPGVDGGLQTSCLSPCHGFNGIVEQWKTSVHFATYVANLGGTEVDSWTGAQACGNCHAADALTGRAAGTVNAPGVGDAGVPNVKNGGLTYRTAAASTGASEATYAGSVKVAAVNCTTCHAVTPANDPHRTGAPTFVTGSFPWRAPVGVNDLAYIAKSPDTTAVTGQSVGARGFSNTCMFCHKSRKDVTNYITPTNNSISQYWGPHEGPQTDVFSAKGGYHFASVVYGTAKHEQSLACVDCHMPDNATNGNFPDHSFYPQLAVCTKSCLVGETSFNINGAQTAFAGKTTTNPVFESYLGELQRLLNTAGLITRSTTTGLTAAELGDGQWSLDTGRTASGVTGDMAGALYNYFLLARGSAKVVHNPKYSRQLMWDSVFALKGAAPNNMPVRP